MDQTSKYVMLSKRRPWINPRSQATLFASAYNNQNHSSALDASWEEQAFAEDTLLHVWPPRSYSCTFCQREFRSAQALGGHMNVHRRDRARLRQQQQPASPNSQSNPNTPSDDCTTDPTVNHDTSYASVVKDHKPKDPILTALIVNNTDNDRDQVLVPKDLTRMVVASLKRKGHCRINELDEALISKRRCVTPVEFPLFATSNSPIPLQQLQNEVTLKSTVCPNEELDLELRLGYCPKIR
ncbi:hypothetical protein LUZ62_020217 [Rhynchospora pubera]|uniref:C2H2-type domain-containing protein n=1 Tax=Rhynchospora pubera TaxID=906938 RepID=A0AAV8EHZ6_9POAL|nr:hypothetical protein LUZ62_064072 [Rhynchospora pubera]KAJ4807651.1 hypothetical protein LUZ62_020217 [Rhynchospora pubera]